MSRYDSMRASDADRDAVTERLREAAGEGRLEPDELEERIDRALRARTYGELARLVADLPRPPNPPWRRPGGRTRAVARSALLAAGLLAAVRRCPRRGCRSRGARSGRGGLVARPRCLLALPPRPAAPARLGLALASRGAAAGAPPAANRPALTVRGAPPACATFRDAAGHADPRTGRRYDPARYSLDRHPTYAVA